MRNLKKLSIRQLNIIIDDAKAELGRRNQLESAVSEITSVLEKYNLKTEDISLFTPDRRKVSGRKKKSSSSQKMGDKRHFVQKKYKDPNGSATWTGRGRTPKWVLAICDSENLTLEDFKKEKRFRF